MNHLIDLMGRRIGRLQVIGLVSGRDWRGQRDWLCRCDCGAVKPVKGFNLRSGSTVSCGCYRAQVNFKHGLKNSSEYRSWVQMKGRCSNQSNQDYRHYGGRGITVCRRWRESFTAFLSDMGRRPSPQHTLDRRNNDGNYTPSNCRWATQEEQKNNKRTNHFVTYKGVTLTLAQWSRKTGINYSTIRDRATKQGLTPAGILR